MMNINLLTRVKFLDKVLFTKHLATMVKAGIPLAEALAVLGEETKSKTFKKILSVVLSDVENGQALAKSLAEHPKIFDHFYISLIEVGEASGTLEESLDFLAEQMGKDYALRRKIKGALLYPGLVLGTMFIMGGFIALFILPKLVGFFAAFEVDLPFATKVLLLVATLMKDHGVLIAAFASGSLALGYFLIKLPLIRPQWHRLTLKLPLVGRLLSYGQLARFTRNFGVLLKSGVPVIKSLDVTAKTLSNLKFQNDLLEISDQLAKGQNIGEAMRQKKFDEFPVIVTKMVSVGEKTGKLDETLLYLGDFYEEEIDDATKNLTNTLEPVLLIIIGLAVGFVALAIITPIYELTGSIRR